MERPAPQHVPLRQKESSLAGASLRSDLEIDAIGERLLTIGLFDADWYLKTWTDVCRSGLDPLNHFLKYGQFETRDPGPDFDTRWYAKTYAAEIPDGISPVQHYILIGHAAGYATRSFAAPSEERVPNTPSDIDARVALLKSTSLFSPSFYLSTYPDVDRSNADPYLHYVLYGGLEQRKPSLNFDPVWYRKKNMEAGKHSEPDALHHYLTVGQAAGSKAKPDNLYREWRDTYHCISREQSEALAVRVRAGMARMHLLIDVRLRQDGSAAALRPTMDSLTAGLGRGLASKVSVVMPNGSEVEPGVLDALQSIGGDGIASPNWRDAGPHAEDALVLLVTDQVRFRSDGVLMLLDAALTSGADLVYSDFETGGLDEAGFFLPESSPRLFKQLGGAFSAVILTSRLMRQVHRQGPVLCPMQSLLSMAPDDLAQYSVQHLPEITYQSASPITIQRIAAPAAAADQTVTIIIPTRNQVDFLRPCIDSIRRMTDYDLSKVSIVVVDNQSDAPDALEYFSGLQARGHVEVLRFERPFNYSAMNNLAASRFPADFYVFLNNDTVIIDPLWLRKILGEMQQPDVGIVGCKLLYPDQTVQHSGVVVGVQGVAAHSHVGLASNAPGFQSLNLLTREVSAVTGALLGVRAAAFEQVGGFDTSLEVAFNDTALCVTIGRKGYRILCLADPLAIHYESKSRGYDTTSEKRARFQQELMRFTLAYRPTAWRDPYYNGNLDLHDMYELAAPPRLVRPWRRQSGAGQKPRVLLLSITYQVGHGVAVVIAEQARRLVSDGYEVILGGPGHIRELTIQGTSRAVLETAAEAAEYAITSGADLVLVHTPPFYSIIKYLVGGDPEVILYDYGEPPPSLFPDREARTNINRDKAFCFALATHRVAISDAIADESGDPGITVLPLANSHLGRWDATLAARRDALRDIYGWTDAFVILNVCRFQRAERYYKGVDHYIDLALRAKIAMSSKRVIVVMCGKASASDVAELTAAGISVFANVSDRELLNLYAAADIYMNLSKWEGYNLGIAQALAMGLPVLASKIPAHDAFGVETFLDDTALLARLCALIADPPSGREAKIWNWSDSLDIFSRYLSSVLGAPAPAMAQPPDTVSPGLEVEEVGGSAAHSWRAARPQNQGEKQLRRKRRV